MSDISFSFMPSGVPLWKRVAAIFNPNIELPDRELDSAVTRMRNLLKKS